MFPRSYIDCTTVISAQTLLRREDTHLENCVSKTLLEKRDEDATKEASAWGPGSPSRMLHATAARRLPSAFAKDTYLHK
jgi:hypothetical protein